MALEKKFEGARITRKGDLYPSNTPPSFKIVAPGRKYSSRPTITTPSHALQIFTDASKEGWGTHLEENTRRGTWSLPKSKLHINYRELKVVFLALKEFKEFCSDKRILVATDNTTVVAYINKEGGMRSGPLCALLWRILTWCSRKQVTLKAQHISGRLYVVADQLFILGQTVQTEWSLLPEVFQLICTR